MSGTNMASSTSFVDASQLGGSPAEQYSRRDGGYTTFTDPTFRNQGQCIAYVKHHDSNGNDAGRG
ncbi:MAG: hypothetical protein ACRDPB_09240 [Nocardioidaceae bacterium]